MERITVKAAPGLQVPMEAKPRSYITDEPVEVDNTAYYQRRLSDGDLVLVDVTRKEAKRGQS